MHNYSTGAHLGWTDTSSAADGLPPGSSTGDPSRTKPAESSATRNRAQARLIAEVARMYYEERRTQLEIATSLNVSQGTVCRFLKRAEKLGIVRTTISPPVGTFVDLEELLERKFGLSQVIIAQAPGGSEESMQGAVGAAAAHFLEITLRPRAVIGVASWSASLLSMVEQMHPVWKVSECKVVQILGGEGHPSIEKHASYLVSQLARLVQGDAHLLPAPGLLASKEVADILAQDPHVRETMELFDRITVALLGIGSIEPLPWLVGSGNTFSIEELQRLEEKGAVGNICLRFYNASGEEIRDAVDGDRVFGLKLERLKSIPLVVGIACGKRKRQAILGALRGRWINVLVTDQFTAESLVMT
jgi:DNA-binding transcriptional regulator LsrR (DeoR family)